MYEKQVEQLKVLQKVDDDILLLEVEIDQAPKDVADLESRHTSLEKRKEQLEEKLVLLQEQQKKLEFEIEEDGVKVKKSKSKLMLVGTTKEYHAMMREMDSLEKLNRLREEEKITVLEETTRQNEMLVETNEKIEALNVELEEKRVGLKAKLTSAQTKLDKLNRQRGKCGLVVPAPILGRYEFIRSRLAHPVIVPVMEAVCTGCNIMIPPQVYNSLQEGKQIISCPNCQRLTYWVEVEPEPEPVKPKKAPKKKAAKKAAPKKKAAAKKAAPKKKAAAKKDAEDPVVASEAAPEVIVKTAKAEEPKAE